MLAEVAHQKFTCQLHFYEHSKKHQERGWEPIIARLRIFRIIHLGGPAHAMNLSVYSVLQGVAGYSC